ncbi:MAG: sigma-70 family RNA polymerase sigma factor [Bacteroides sp.]
MTRTTEARLTSTSSEAQPLPETVLLDEQGLHDIFQQYYAPLCLFAYQFTDDREQAADLAQEAFIKLWELRTNFSYLHQVRSFLYLTVRNRALNELEHRRVVEEYAANYQLKASEVFFEETLIEQETYRILTEAIDSLPTRMREVMRLALRGKKNAEIAEQLECSIENVRSLRQQAYKRLRFLLKDYYYSLLLFILQLPH